MKKMRGVATVEFAIVGAVLMMVIFGCLEFGRATYTFAALNEGARRAARLAAVCPINDPKILPAVNFLGTNGYSTANVTYLDANGAPLGGTPASSAVYYVQVNVIGSLPLAIPFLSARSILRRAQNSPVFKWYPSDESPEYDGTPRHCIRI